MTSTTDTAVAAENERFWRFVEETAIRVETAWPQWKKEGWDVLDRPERSSLQTGSQY